MSSKSTTNYQLNQWEPTDPVLRTDFNEDNGKIENALTGLAGSIPKIACGTYTGDGAESRTISLGFTPKAVFVIPNESQLYIRESAYYYIYGGLAVSGSPTVDVDSAAVLTILTGGFQVVYRLTDDNRHQACTNVEGLVYHYIAVG